MPSAVKPRAQSQSPHSKRVDAVMARLWGDAPADVDPSTASGSTTTTTASGTIVKKQKSVSGAAVAVKVEPTSTPRKPLGPNGADLLAAAGVSVPPVPAAATGGSASQQKAAAKAAGRRDKEAKMQSLKQDEQDFVAKYTRAFPAFVFHFDSAEPGPFGAKARDLGARIDKFFSRSVTHVITSRPIPTFKDKENAPPTSRRITIGGTDARPAGSKSAKSITNPFLDETGESDVLLKALTFKMKVWDVKKFQSVINRLLPSDVSPKKARIQNRHKVANAEAAAATLSHLLEDERKNGTRERDQNAPRPDYQYFARGGFYVLCEDATAEFRTIIAREYERPRNGELPEWPVLHETFLKPSSSKFAPPPRPPPPPAAAALPHIAAQATDANRPIARLPARMLKGDTGVPDLRRSASLNNLGRATKLATLDETRHPAAADHDGAYIAASGNSVNITSNTTSAQSGAGNTFDRQGREKAIAELNRKTVAFHQAPRATAASAESSRSAVIVGEPSSVRKRKTRAALAAVAQAEAEKEQAALEAKERADRARRELKASGKMDPPPMKKRHSLPANLQAEQLRKEKVRLPPREETKKPGYCENCRNKFEDFAAHIVSRRHRRFALNDDHFADLDRVLARLDRQIIGRPVRHYDRLHLDSAGYDSEEEEEDDYSEEYSSEQEDEEEYEEDEIAEEIQPTIRIKEEPTEYEMACSDDDETASS